MRYLRTTISGTLRRLKSVEDRRLETATQQKIAQFVGWGALYAVAFDPRTRDVFELGQPPDRLLLNFAAIFDVD